MRITGLASGLDMDEIVKNSMKPYRIKIDKKGQDKEIIEIKQKLYREIIKDSREYYNKYFDVTKSDSLLLSKNWSSVKFESSNKNVLTVSASSDAIPGNYTVTGTVAKAATQTIDNLGDSIIINGKTFRVEGANNKEKATNLNRALSEAGIKVSVRYTEFAGEGSANASGFIFESKVLGSDSVFTIGGSEFKIINPVKGENAIAATITGFKIGDFNINSLNTIKLTVNGEEKSINIDWDSIKNDDNSDIDKTKLQEVLNSKLKEYNFSATITDTNIEFKSTILGKDIKDPKLMVNNKGSNSNEEDIKFNQGKDATFTTNTLDLNSTDISSKKISVNGNIIDLSKATPGKENEYVNKVLKQNNINITATLSGDNLILTSNIAGADYNVDLSIVSNDSEISSNGADSNILIKNEKGGVYKLEGNSNTVTLDGVTFKLNGDIPIGETVTINGKKDVSDIKDNLVKFINDYNTLIEKLNKLTTEKRNREFDPLTAEQKKEMSEDEIKLWNEKVEKGQLSRDTDLSRISNSLKQAMRTLVDGTGLNLEKIGISPVADYAGTKNGTFTIDEEKLTKALEENSQGVMDMFIKSKPNDNSMSDSTKYSKTGIMQRIKDTLYNETVTVASSLLKKAGIDGSSTAYNNELTKSIEKYEQKMKDMETDFSRREQALYSKYANLETIMNKYNSQQSYLTQQLGLG
ncbi:flagellar filament capping protein FliD [Clostridium sp. AL.422]|uniref:flagellar filament capping protein FliD n=1 Tax=Clostridium TaxID=1485 RepID=UPI00293E0016|nr:MULTISPECIES: flagellar filament capping protein FliD [unclassified Clostridium]MDV4149719.1 flagellar filament capping protein FliD [Clostridium sp. AL.422]